jgi:hypothetical protein
VLRTQRHSVNGFFNWEVVNPTKKGVERKIDENATGDHLEKTPMMIVTSLKWGKVTCLFKWTFECEGLLSWGLSLDHRGTTPR